VNRMFKNIFSQPYLWEAGVAKSLQCLDTDWTIGRSRFDCRQRQSVFPLTSVFRPALGPTPHLVQWIDCRFVVAVRLPSQHCGLGPVVLSPDDSDVNQ
jgi:hypothetical protein